MSSSLTITQDRIDAFAEATEDRQFIHIDPEAETPFGGTIAHGFLSLSLLSRMAADVVLLPETTRVVINYGLDRVRFLSAVRAGKQVRGRFVLMGLDDRAQGQWLARYNVTVEIEDEERPALTADWLTLIVT